MYIKSTVYYDTGLNKEQLKCLTMTEVINRFKASPIITPCFV